MAAAVGWAGLPAMVLSPGPAGAAMVPPALPPAYLVADAPDPREIECLAQAISFESGNEPVGGQEAVAQVVLNRLRAPQFPKTVCSVVYQGSTRRTGCQFTFTCDGSLSRPRRAGSMAAARVVAERMLRGGRAPEVADAVNYHADYVAPGWARSLARVTKIGAHIFYRLPDGQGRSAAAPSGGEVTRPPGAVPVPGVFTPWGVPTLAITRGGAVSPVGPSVSVATAD